MLCGGASRRMGRDKAFVEVAGVPMAAQVRAALLAGGCSPVVAIGGDTAGLALLGFEVVPDEFPGDGPLGGVLTALARHRDADAVLVAACDLPSLSAASVRTLVEGLGTADVAVARGDRLQPACAVWKVSTAATLREVFLAGERRLLAALQAVHVAEIDLHPQDLANVNAPSDLPQ